MDAHLAASPPVALRPLSSSQVGRLHVALDSRDRGATVVGRRAAGMNGKSIIPACHQYILTTEASHHS